MPDVTHEGNDPMGARSTHRGPLETCPAPECQDQAIEQQEDAVPDLTDVQKAYNVAQHEMFQLAAYGHHRYHPLQECLTPEGKRQERDYNDRLRKAREDLEAAVLRLVAEHAETYFASWDATAAWLRFLADDPGELSMLALRPEERGDETFDDWRTESLTARIAAAQQQPELTPCTCRQAVHALEHRGRTIPTCPWCTPAPNIRPNRAAPGRAVDTVDTRLLNSKET